MKQLIPTIILVVINLSSCIYANTYYISSSNGNDNNDGLSIDFPFSSLEKINAINFNAGDTILFKSGDLWEGMLWIKGSGSTQEPIIIDSYGGNIKPIINGNGYQSCVLIYNDDNIFINNLELLNEDSHLDSLGNVKKLVGFGGASNSWGSGKDVRFGIKIVADEYSLSNFKISNVYIHDIFPTPESQNNIHKGYGIKLETLSDTLNDVFNTISNIEFSNNVIYKTGHYGFWIKSLGLNMNFDEIKNDEVHLFDCVFEHTGGSGFVPNKSSNVLVENCMFNHSGSGIDERMWKRGSGMWTFDCLNVIAQENSFMNAHGPLDSYGCHIDYGCENVVFQYNYSFNNEGGFVEILGDNINCGYRYNISINDGYRLGEAWSGKQGKTFFISNYCGSSNIRCPSTGTFIYNNTSFVNDTLSPEIYCWPNAGDIHIYNNLVYATPSGSIIPTLIENDSNIIDITHNLFFDVNRFYLDEDLWLNAIYEDPEIVNTNPLGGIEPEEYQVYNNSVAINNGRLISGSNNMLDYLENNGGRDYFGNPVSNDTPPTIGAFNYNTSNNNIYNDIEESSVIIYPNPATKEINIALGLLTNDNNEIIIYDSVGKIIYFNTTKSKNITVDIFGYRKGLYTIVITNHKTTITKKVLIN